MFSTRDRSHILKFLAQFWEPLKQRDDKSVTTDSVIDFTILHGGNARQRFVVKRDSSWKRHFSRVLCWIMKMSDDREWYQMTSRFNGGQAALRICRATENLSISGNFVASQCHVMVQISEICQTMSHNKRWKRVTSRYSPSRWNSYFITRDTLFRTHNYSYIYIYIRTHTYIYIYIYVHV